MFAKRQYHSQIIVSPLTMSSSVLIALAIGGIFAPLGGLCAGIITYSEYASHRLPKGRALQEALRSGLLAICVLVALTGALGWFMDHSS